MKTQKSIVLIALTGIMLIAGQSFAQRGNRGTRPYDCYQNIPNLNEEQKQQITELRNAHLEEIAELRSERRSTAARAEKNEIRGKMLQQQQEHKNEIRALLNEDQKAYFDRNYKSRSQALRSGNGKGKGNGNFNANGKGNRGKGSSGKGNGNSGVGNRW